MYNPYLTQSWEDRMEPPIPSTEKASPVREKPWDSVLKSLNLKDLDTGDVLLLLILLFLFLDDREDNLELLITLGLLLLL